MQTRVVTIDVHARVKLSGSGQSAASNSGPNPKACQWPTRDTTAHQGAHTAWKANACSKKTVGSSTQRKQVAVSHLHKPAMGPDADVILWQQFAVAVPVALAVNGAHLHRFDRLDLHKVKHTLSQPCTMMHVNHMQGDLLVHRQQRLQNTHPWRRCPGESAGTASCCTCAPAPGACAHLPGATPE